MSRFLSMFVLCFAALMAHPAQAASCTDRTVQMAAAGFSPEANASGYWQVEGAGFYGYMSAADTDTRDVYLALPTLPPDATLTRLTIYGYRTAGTLTGEVYRMADEGGLLVGQVVISTGTGYLVTGTPLATDVMDDSAYFARIRIKNAGQASQVKAMRLVLSYDLPCTR